MTSTRTPRLLGQKQNKFLLTVCLCALTAALIFLPFYLLDGGFFHYAGDFNSQQISFYRYTCTARRSSGSRCSSRGSGSPT